MCSLIPCFKPITYTEYIFNTCPQTPDKIFVTTPSTAPCPLSFSLKTEHSFLLWLQDSIHLHVLRPHKNPTPGYTNKCFHQNALLPNTSEIQHMAVPLGQLWIHIQKLTKIASS